MAVSNTNSLVQYSGNGSTVTVYPVPFLFFETGHLAVEVVDSFGQSTALVLGSDFTVTGAKNPVGGSLRTTMPWNSSYTISIRREAPITQPYVYSEGQRLPMKTIERNFDWLATLIQQVAAAGKSVLRFPAFESPSNNTVLPPAGNRRDSLIFFNQFTGEMETISMIDLAVKISTLLNGDGILPYRVKEIISDYTVNPADGNSFVRIDSTAPVVVNLPTTEGLATSFSMEFSRVGVGSVTFVPASGVVIDSTLGQRRVFGQFSSVALRVIGPNRYAIYGDLY